MASNSLTRASRTRTVATKTSPRIPGGIYSTVAIDVAGLEKALRKAVTGEVRFDAGSKAM